MTATVYVNALVFKHDRFYGNSSFTRGCMADALHNVRLIINIVLFNKDRHVIVDTVNLGDVY